MLQVQYDQVITVLFKLVKLIYCSVNKIVWCRSKCENKLDVPPQHLTPSLHRLQYPTPSSISFVSLFLLRLKYAQTTLFPLELSIKSNSAFVSSAILRTITKADKKINNPKENCGCLKAGRVTYQNTVT